MERNEEWAAKAEAHLARLRDAIRRALVEARSKRPELSAGRLSRQMGRHTKYVSKMVTGEGLLRVVEVCKLLERAGFPPGEVLQAAFPPGGAAELRLRARAEKGRASRGQGKARGVLPLDGLRASLRRVSARRSPGEVTERCRAALRRRIAASPYSQRELSQALDMRSPRALGYALWGDTDLTFEHVFRTLAALEVEPASLLFEMFDPQEGGVGEGMTLPELLARAHRVQRAAVEVFEAEEEADRREATARAPGGAPPDGGGGEARR